MQIGFPGTLLRDQPAIAGTVRRVLGRLDITHRLIPCQALPELFEVQGRVLATATT